MKFYREASLRIRLRNEDFTFKPDPILIRGLRVSFSITKSLANTTNSGLIRVWNLNQTHRNLIKDFGDEVTLFAGYREEGGQEILFIGNTTAVSHVYEQPEIITVLECGDGERYLNQLRVSLTYAAKTQARPIVEAIATQMGLPIYYFAPGNDLVYYQGLKYLGMGKDALTLVCNYLGMQWSVQNGGLQIIPINGSNEKPILEVNENAGMIGIPQRFTYRRIFQYRSTDAPAQGYKVNIALNPLLIPGTKINLSSTHLGIKKMCSVWNIRHSGDTYGMDWASNLEVTELPAGAT